MTASELLMAVIKSFRTPVVTDLFSQQVNIDNVGQGGG